MNKTHLRSTCIIRKNQLEFVVIEGPNWLSIPFSEKRNTLKQLEEGVIYSNFPFLALIFSGTEMEVQVKIGPISSAKAIASIFLNAPIMVDGFLPMLMHLLPFTTCIISCLGFQYCDLNLVFTICRKNDSSKVNLFFLFLLLKGFRLIGCFINLFLRWLNHRSLNLIMEWNLHPH